MNIVPHPYLGLNGMIIYSHKVGMFPQSWLVIGLHDLHFLDSHEVHDLYHLHVILLYVLHDMLTYITNITDMICMT